jgi:hypothetical protein
VIDVDRGSKLGEATNLGSSPTMIASQSEHVMPPRTNLVRMVA